MHAMTKSDSEKGHVILVGAGPGDVGLLTIKGKDWLMRANVVIYDHLVNANMMRFATDSADLIYVGKKEGHSILTQSEINKLLIKHALAGKIVVRLKGGDPFIFGRGGEEIQALKEAGIRFTVVPGIPSAVGVSAYAGIPLTHRGVAQGCTFITGHMQNDGQLNLPWQSLSCATQTVVFYMGINTLPSITEQLIKHGRDANTPAALIRKGTQPDQQIFRGDLSTLADLVTQHNITPPTLIVIGDVVNQLTDTALAKPGFLDAKDYQMKMPSSVKVG